MPFAADYQCPEGHVTDHIHYGSRDSAPERIPCGEAGCGLEAARALGAPAIRGWQPNSKATEVWARGARHSDSGRD